MAQLWTQNIGVTAYTEAVTVAKPFTFSYYDGDTQVILDPENDSEDLTTLIGLLTPQEFATLKLTGYLASTIALVE